VKAGRNHAKKKGAGQSTLRRTSGSKSNPLSLFRDAQQQANHHRQTRAAHKQELVEDYVEVIADLIETNKEARAADIARRLGVSHVTVIQAVERLTQQKLVTTKPYRSIFLTDAGWRMARMVRHRHEVVVEFLLAIGVRKEVAQSDAEGIEHHVSEETLAAFERVVRTGK